jgi:hypothetical protein
MGMNKTMARRFAGLKDDSSKVIQGIIAEAVAGTLNAASMKALEALRTIKAENDYAPTMAGFEAVRVAEKALTKVYFA